MTTSKILLFTGKSLKNGTHPIVLRVTKDRKVSYLYLGIRVHKWAWDEIECRVRRVHPNYARINNLILNRLTETDNLIIEYETKRKMYSAAEIVRIIKKSPQSDYLQSIFRRLLD